MIYALMLLFSPLFQEYRTVLLASGQLKDIPIGDQNFATIGIPEKYVSNSFLDVVSREKYSLCHCTNICFFCIYLFIYLNVKQKMSLNAVSPFLCELLE